MPRFGVDVSKIEVMFRQENPVLLSGMKFYVYESMPPSVPPAVQRSRVVMKLEASALP